MQKSHAIIGTYNHLPEGTEEGAFEETYQVCWRPFLSVLYRFPDICAVLHYSGTALTWLESRHPEFLMLLEEMVLRKQIELLGGGFFAPLLPLVPGADRLGQIEMLTTFIRKAFGKRPRGCWLQDYAWEPGLASAIQTCGFDFTFLPEAHFRTAGLEGAGLGGPAMTEDQGKSLAVFPSFDAEESFPAPLPPVEALAALRARLGELPLYTVMYTGESARTLWESSGLESPDVFFERSLAALQRAGLEFETTTPSRHLKGLKRLERAYFSGSASARLMRGCGREGDRGSSLGSPRRILLAHEESLALYSKMQYVRILVGQLRGDKSRKKTAQEELWRGQCGDAYWQGPMGGIRRLPVRAAAYAALIEAEKTTRHRGTFSSGIIRADMDFDGEREILFQGLDLNAYVHLRGGGLTELDSFRTKTNYVNAMGAVRAGGRLACFIDHFYEPGAFGEDRGSFSSASYSCVDADKPGSTALLSREGWANIAGRRRNILLRKTYSYRRGAISLDYEIENREADPLRTRFGAELNLAVGFEPATVGIALLRGREATPCDSASTWGERSAEGLRLENLRHGEQVELRAASPFDLEHSPIFADIDGRACVSGGTFYQGCRLLAGWDLDIPPDASRRLSITLELKT